MAAEFVGLLGLALIGKRGLSGHESSSTSVAYAKREVKQEMRSADSEQLAQQVRRLLKDVWLAIEKAGLDYSDSDLTSQQHVIMNLVVEQPDISPTALAEALGVTKSAISQHLSVLEQRKYIIRQQSSEDGRKQTLGLGEAGRVYRDDKVRLEKLATERLALRMSAHELSEVASSLLQLKGVLSSG